MVHRPKKNKDQQVLLADDWNDEWNPINQVLNSIADSISAKIKPNL